MVRWPWAETVEAPSSEERKTLVHETLVAVHEALHREPARQPTEAEQWGLEVRRARRAGGLTQAALAERYELTPVKVSMIERGARHNVRPAVLRAIDSGLDVSPPPEPSDNRASRLS